MIFLMGHPVTTNPFIIMMINMTVVFFVLIALSGIIHLIHKLDPTKEPEVAETSESDEQAAIIAKLKEQQQAAPVAAPQVEEGITPEIIAAISAAIAACGFSGQVRAVKIVGRENSGWRRNALDNGLRKKI